MSRHKLVKNLDLDDEMDDFDGGEDYDYEGGQGGEELSKEDQEQMRISTVAVREQLPADAKGVSDKQIMEALWHYYYDVEKSVRYLVNEFVDKPKKKETKKVTPGYGSANTICESPFSLKEFFRDTPWLKIIPVERQAIFLAPIYPWGGLLGGSGEAAPKISKLQALTAARKKKAQEQKSSDIAGIKKSMVDLKINEENRTGSGSALEESATQKLASRGFPLRKRKDSKPHEKPLKASTINQDPESKPKEDKIPTAEQAAPSAFASTMFNSTTQVPATHSSFIFTIQHATTSPPPATYDPFAGPSPDDVVIAAQSKAIGGKPAGKGPPKTSNEKKADQIANGVEAVKLDDTPRAKSRNLDVLKEFEKAKAKNAANFVVIGHVDAGKSTLMGRLLYDLKIVDQRTIDRYRRDADKMGKSSFALAWVLDQGTEERARGITIDIATNKFKTDKTAFTILDAPGHRDFIPNMIAGAAQADFAVLVVDASTGSFESGLKGQTKEHALLVRSMGVQRIIVAVNKLDTVSWDQDRFTEIEQQISSFLTTAGFLAKNITFIPCSGLLGDNIARRSTESAAAWYKGPTLVEELDNSEPVSRALTKPLRITIGDIFRGGVQNPLSVSGRIECGSLQIGDALLSQPSTQKCFIKSLEIDNEAVDWAVAGQNVTIHLSGIEEQYLKIGDVLCSPSSPINNVKQFTAKVLAFEFLTPMQVEVHRGRLHAPGNIKEIIGVLDKGTGHVTGKKKPRIVKPGQLARVVVELEVEVPLEAPARVVLRSIGETVAAGLLE